MARRFPILKGCGQWQLPINIGKRRAPFGTSNLHRHSIPWAQTIIIASNYVRHKEEWNFNSIEFDKKTRKIRTRKNIIETLEGNRPKKNALYLLKLGVSEEELFERTRDATFKILELANSNDANLLQKNCQEWLEALNSYVKDELFKVI